MPTPDAGTDNTYGHKNNLVDLMQMHYEEVGREYIARICDGKPFLDKNNYI